MIMAPERGKPAVPVVKFWSWNGRNDPWNSFGKAITKAFQDAYDRSLEQQEEKMAPLYGDLGLSTS